MRLLVTFLVLLTTAPARAEITKLGDLQLAQQIKKPATVSITLFGCAGSMRPEIDKRKQVTRVRFDGDHCAKLVKSMTAAISKDFGGAPLVNANGDELWEGKTASIILTTSLSAGRDRPSILLLSPAGGSKRPCWADDGFAAFWTTFKAAIAGGKGVAIAAAFAFPVRDFEDKVRFKDARSLAKHWTTIIDKRDAEEVGRGELTASCMLDDATYELSLSDSNHSLTATQVDGVWHWSTLDDQAPG
jgi:hypothetical protein